VLRLLGQLSRSLGSREVALQQFGFLRGYWEELSARGADRVPPESVEGWWRDSLLAWERGVDAHLPLRALREAAALDHATMTALMSAGLGEEDARFGLLFEALHGLPGQHRPTAGLLQAWWAEAQVGSEARAGLRRLRDLGLIQALNPDAPRNEWLLQPPAVLWDVLRGEAGGALAPWVRYREPETLPRMEELILSESVRRTLAALPTLLDSGESRALIVRGPRRNGRRTVLGALARRMGMGTLEVGDLGGVDGEPWRLLGALAVGLRALPVVVLDDVAAGETAEAPALHPYDGPIGLVLGRHGGVTGQGVARALTLSLETPDVSGRRAHWTAALGSEGCEDLGGIAARYRLTGGNIRRAASAARSYALLGGRRHVTLDDVRQASRALNREALDTLAARVEVGGDWTRLAVGEATARELRGLTSRCLHRERLHELVGEDFGAQLNPGVRALFSGPSGTGKTLAARLLASVLSKDLYRLDLSSVVNKYIGETEKNLSRVFDRAEELDVILLLDEGDALLTQRTEVQSSNDRYANLETNYLLQRLESFEGIIVVTTNAPEKIDSAFQRRMDVVVEFRAPEIEERWHIWTLHLPAQHAIDPGLLGEVAGRCPLTGGQIRNAVLHASLLALDDGGVVTSPHLEAAVRREYRKAGLVYPLNAWSNGSSGVPGVGAVGSQ
jgi:hypothetical protein